MTLYEINEQILNWQPEIDEATGEVINFGYFDELQVARDEKIENIALWVKELNAESAAIRAEEVMLAERRRASENKANRLKSYLQLNLNGEKFTTPRVAISHRKSAAVECDTEFVEWAQTHAPDLLKYKEPEVNKTAIRDYLKSNECEHARVVESEMIQIK